LGGTGASWFPREQRNKLQNLQGKISKKRRAGGLFMQTKERDKKKICDPAVTKEKDWNHPRPAVTTKGVPYIKMDNCQHGVKQKRGGQMK